MKCYDLEPKTCPFCKERYLNKIFFDESTWKLNDALKSRLRMDQFPQQKLLAKEIKEKERILKNKKEECKYSSLVLS